VTIPLYTIGHGNRSSEAFLVLLQLYEIDFLVDVRSQPYSRYNPQFTRTSLEQSVVQHGLRYIFMGDTLGGRPADESCYVNGKVDYALVRAKPFYQRSIDRLRVAWEKQLRVALMCAELKPQECHRSKLIGNTLLEQHIAVAHIDEDGGLKGQEVINLLLTGGQLALFEDVPLVDLNGRVGRSRKAYTASDEVEG
jgi:uncharacterized protein (DUF488 family)